MGDLKVGETFTDCVFITPIGSKVGAIGLTPTCYSVKASDGTRTLLSVSEVGSGHYKASFTPDAAGTWAVEWQTSNGYTAPLPKNFKVGGGRIEDINTALTVVDSYHDVPMQDSAVNNQMRDVIGNKTDTSAGSSVIGLLKKIDAKTSNLPSDPSDESNIISEIDTKIAAIQGVGWTTQTLKAISDSIAALNNITAASVWAVGTRALTDKASFTLASGEYDNIRKSVCLVGDSAASIGKILYDLNSNYTSTRAGYVDTIKSSTDKIGTITNTGGTASIGAVLGDVANSSIATLLNTILTQLTFQVQAPGALSQASPVQNTYYTVLNTTSNACLMGISASVASTGENLDACVTIDGQTLYPTAYQAATAGSIYYLQVSQDNSGWVLRWTSTPPNPLVVECRNLKVELRKTSNNGSGTLTGCCTYSKR